MGNNIAKLKENTRPLMMTGAYQAPQSMNTSVMQPQMVMPIEDMHNMTM